MSRLNNYLGFSGVNDLTDSLFKPKDWDVNAMGAAIASVTTFISGYVWDSPPAIYALWALMLMDWITGIWKSCKSMEFVSYKLFRMPLYFIVTSFLLSISWWMSKESMIFYALPSMVYGGFMSVYLLSLLENLCELELLPKPLADAVTKRFGLKSVIGFWEKKYNNGADVHQELTKEEEEDGQINN